MDPSTSKEDESTDLILEDDCDSQLSLEERTLFEGEQHVCTVSNDDSRLQNFWPLQTDMKEGHLDSYIGELLWQYNLAFKI